jgi:hypothetical protein
MRPVLVAAVCAGMGVFSCAHLGPAPAGPEGTARAYADALAANRLDAALQLSTGLDAERFGQLYADPQVRAERVQAVRAAADGAANGGTLKLSLEGGGWRVQELEPARPQVQQQAAEALGRFLDAAEAGDFEGALQQLAASWRNRYTAQRFAEDFGSEPLATERLQRARGALGAGSWVVDASGAQLPLGEGRAVRLSREGDGYRVAALE